MGVRWEDNAGYRNLDGVDPSYVEKHLRLARKVLGVETTAQAVIRAAFVEPNFPKQVFPFKAFTASVRQKVCFSLLVDI